MQVQFIIGKEIKYTTRLNMTREELFRDPLNEQKQKFKIPINVNIFIKTKFIFLIIEKSISHFQ
jgi:hypothetical protein